ncbi:hypothetical protein F2Q69_00037882 [Brassica cretica]|uniref:Uncharacterized protein n=1 Tax=Brassica cretica TaxID=69181 RepID=A0A8S9SP42_BRACR|nr:hypothetical protein F2Q69_00037882 [Brassica cretica]
MALRRYIAAEKGKAPHGKPFGNRIPPPDFRGQSLRNKLVPSRRTSEYTAASRQQGRALNQHNEVFSRGREDTFEYHHQTHTIPTTEEVLEELREVTHRYTNVPDKVESAARHLRVAQSEEEGLMERTAAGIIAAETRNLSREEPEPQLPITVFDRLEAPSNVSLLPSVFNKLDFQTADNGTKLPAIPESPPREVMSLQSGRKKRKKIGPSPRILAGASSRKRNLSRASPARHGFPYASPIMSQQGRQCARVP